MDIYCPKCGEPLDLDELHEVEGKSFKEAYASLVKNGCGLLFGSTPCKPADETMERRGQFSGALMEILGSDIDGVAAELEDAEYFGLI